MTINGSMVSDTVVAALIACALWLLVSLGLVVDAAHAAVEVSLPSGETADTGQSYRRSCDRACPPVIMYTDVLSGPNEGGENNRGAYLSLFGLHFGDAADLGGSTKVYIDGVEVAAYVHLGPARAQIYAHRVVQQLSVQVGSLGRPSPGVPLPIRVVVDGRVSNDDHTFTVQPGNIYYVDNVNGDDKSARPNDPNRPWRYVQGPDKLASGVVRHVKPGDFIVMRGGATWTDVGAGKRFLRLRYLRGTAPTGKKGSGPITLTGYPGEDVLIQCQPETACGIHGINGFSHPDNADWFTIANLRIRGGGPTVYDGPVNLQHQSDHWRIVNNELFEWDANDRDGRVIDGKTRRAARAGGITGDGRHIEILGNHIHDIGGGKLNHGIYIDGGARDFVIAYNHIAHITGGNLIQLFDSVKAEGSATFISNGSIHHNRLHDGNRYGLNFSAGTQSVYAYNNLIYNTALAGVRFATDISADIAVFHNTFYNVCVNPPKKAYQALINDGRGSGMVVSNNIVHANRRCQGYYSFTAENAKDGAQLVNNLYAGLGRVAPPQDRRGLSGELQFVDPNGGDFRLREGGAAVDNAVVSAGLDRVGDYALAPRLRGVAPDIGAYEFAGPTLPSP